MRIHLQALLLTSALSSIASAIALPTPAVAQQPSLTPTSYRSATIPCATSIGPDEVEGKQAMTGLSNGIYLEFPKAGHGVLQFSQCAKDVGAAFVNNPTQLPNATCRKPLKPKFVLPTASR